MLQFQLAMEQLISWQVDAFEAELASKNLKFKISDSVDAEGLVTIMVSADTAEEVRLVKELAALCFGYGHKV
jgi:hypothetical protein